MSNTPNEFASLTYGVARYFADAVQFGKDEPSFDAAHLMTAPWSLYIANDDGIQGKIDEYGNVEWFDGPKQVK